MKALTIFVAAALIIIAAAFVFSCNKERITVPAEKDYAAEILKTIYDGMDCNSGCLQTGPFEQSTVSFTRQWSPVPGFTGYFKNNKYFVTTAWHDRDFFYIKTDIFGYQYNRTKVDGAWTLTGPAYGNYPFANVMITLNGIEYNYSMDDPATTDVIESVITFTQSFPMPSEWGACDEMSFSVRLQGEGQPVWTGSVDGETDVAYGLFGICTATSITIDRQEACMGDDEVTLSAIVAPDGDFSNFAGGAVSIIDDATNEAVATGTHSVIYTFIPSFEGIHTFHAEYSGEGSNGFKGSESEPVSVIVVNCNCENAMTGTTSCLYFYDDQTFLGNRMAAFTFLSGENGIFKIQGELANFSGDHFSVTSTTGAVSSWISGDGSNRVISVDGPVTECETITLTVYWDSESTDDIITANWFAELNGTEVLLLDDMICFDVKTGYPPSPGE
jgi:hypothetical protein